MPKEVETGLYRITLEAMNNMAKYARASELHVLLARSDGGVTLQIAGRLVIGVTTVYTHVSNILSKLRLATRTQAALYALREGYVPLYEEAD